MPLACWQVVFIKSQQVSRLELSYDKTFCEEFAHYLLSTSKSWLPQGSQGNTDLLEYLHEKYKQEINCYSFSGLSLRTGILFAPSPVEASGCRENTIKK